MIPRSQASIVEATPFKFEEIRNNTNTHLQAPRLEDSITVPFLTEKNLTATHTPQAHLTIMIRLHHTNTGAVRTHNPVPPT